MSKWYVTECCLAPTQSGKCLRCGKDARCISMVFKLKETMPRQNRDWVNPALQLVAIGLGVYMMVTLVKIIYLK